MHTLTHPRWRCGKRQRASIGGQTGGIARLSAGGYRRALGSVAARNARGIHWSNGRTGTSERVEQLMGRLPRRTPVSRTLSFPHATPRAAAGAASCPDIGVTLPPQHEPRVNDSDVPHYLDQMSLLDVASQPRVARAALAVLLGQCDRGRKSSTLPAATSPCPIQYSLYYIANGYCQSVISRWI